MIDKNIICFLTFQPSASYYNLCKELLNGTKYDGYICIDDNNYDIPNYDGKISIIKIDNEESENEGFKNSVTYFKDRACSRDKALFYFCKLETEYNYIWFLEEDVFVPSKNTIPNLEKYQGDLLCSTNDIIENLQCEWFFTKRTFNEYKGIFAPPYAKSMVCAIRVSRKLMVLVEEYADYYKTFSFCETMFNTLALKNDLEITCPQELSTIVFQKDWKINRINRRNLYHPIKDMDIQMEYRNHIRNCEIRNPL